MLDLSIKPLILSYFDDEVISLLDLGIERSREAMMLRAPETEALDEGYAQRGSEFQP
jgi:hypothetical protein